jgi:phosphatidate cytidylyltransferase
VTRGLKQRIITAALLGVFVLAVLLRAPISVILPVIAVFMLAGAWEWSRFAGLEGPATRGAYVLAIGSAMLVTWKASADSQVLVGFLGLAALWWLLAFLWILLGPRRGGALLAALCGFFVIVPAAVAVARLVAVQPQGRLLLIFLIVLIAAADVGAYFGGRSLGKHKLAPVVSPGKTWEGFLSGILAAGAIALAGSVFFAVRPAPWVMLCVLVVLVSVVGDLSVSMFKRRAGLKDSGTLLPGHGGVLDRIDSILAAGPVFLLGVMLLGLAG